MVTDTKRKRWWKRQASKAVRRADVQDGGTYKRVYDSYDICDYRFPALGSWCKDIRERHKAVAK